MVKIAKRHELWLKQKAYEAEQEVNNQRKKYKMIDNFNFKPQTVIRSIQSF